MKSFRAGGIDYPTSIAVDASTYGDVTTAVAVPASRREEVDILAEIHEAADENGVEFVPFKSKSSHFSKDDHQAFFSQLIDANKSRLAGLHFQHHSASRNQHYVEAVLTAILLNELRAELPTPWFALVDGDLNKVKTLAKACAGIGVDSPTLTTATNRSGTTHTRFSQTYPPASLRGNSTRKSTTTATPSFASRLWTGGGPNSGARRSASSSGNNSGRTTNCWIPGLRLVITKRSECESGTMD